VHFHPGLYRRRGRWEERKCGFHRFPLSPVRPWAKMRRMSAAASAKKKKPREWAPRIWQGCSFPAWASLLGRNRFAVSPPHWYIAAFVTGVSPVPSVIRFLEEAFYRHEVARTPIRHAPLFILGHWRSGTTLLHELLILDPRHAFPTTYQCLEP